MKIEDVKRGMTGTWHHTSSVKAWPVLHLSVEVRGIGQKRVGVLVGSGLRARKFRFITPGRLVLQGRSCEACLDHHLDQA